ncbi:DUF4258 domain-containing protein [Bdellovibrionota bacterium FG-2]
MDDSILSRVRKSARKRILFLPHAVRQMSRSDRMISAAEVRKTIMRIGIIVEDYPTDARGHSCLILGHPKGKRPVHVVCSPKDEYLAIITAYVPDQKQWNQDFTRRRTQ